MREIKFKQEFTRSCGRNGRYKTVGVYIGTTYTENVYTGKVDGKAISLTGLNSRGIPASGDLSIPISEIDNFIELLKTFRTNHENIFSI